MWWIFENKRLISEKAALQELEGQSEWLHVINWYTLDVQNICVDFEITLSEETFMFQMLYPSVFPDVPPMIYTKNRIRISSHQYGAEGELCLEHRPDNWRPELTGANMVASCYNLLKEEHPNNSQPIQIRSAHRPSLGRDLRTVLCRFLVTDSDIDALNRLHMCVPKTIHLREQKGSCGKSYISSIKHIGESDAIIWASDLNFPPGAGEYSGFVVRVSGVENLASIDTDGLRGLLDRHNLKDLCKSLIDVSETTQLLIGDESGWTLLWIFSNEYKGKVIPYKTVSVPSHQKRLSDEFDVLSDKNVGIVGCGSVGSKIAASLCRSGVGKFMLIDEDVFFPANVVRNELTLKDIGCHKSYALKSHLLELNPLCYVSALRLSLGGQNSAKSMTGALEALGQCDILIDATADPTAFSLIASVAKRQKKAMIWAEVFSGGFGGLVARSRPELDPTPLYAKQQIELWCEENGANWIRPEGAKNYEGVDDKGNPMIADDAEVSIIALHATRFATDYLVRPKESIFPVSAYLVGLSSNWLFEQPFDTWPIQLSVQGSWGNIIDQLPESDLIKVINDHLATKKNKDETSNP